MTNLHRRDAKQCISGKTEFVGMTLKGEPGPNSTAKGGGCLTVQCNSNAVYLEKHPQVSGSIL